MTSLSVVIPATNEPPTLDRCLGAVRAAHGAPDDVVVVDDPHLSASEARNEGARRARHEVVVFVDADVEVHADAFARISRVFDEHPDLTAVFGSYDDDPADRSVVSAFRNLLHHHVHHEGAGPAETFWTGLGAIRRSTFLRLGGFDAARYPHPSIEDIEFGDRLRASGARTLLDPAIQGTHLKRWGLRSMLWTDLRRRAVPWIALQVRTRRPATTLNCGWRHKVSAIACVMAVVASLAAILPVVLAAVTVLIGANASFYGLLVRRLGWVGALGGVALHVLHHLVAVVAVPFGIAAALFDTRPSVVPLRAAALSAREPTE